MIERRRLLVALVAGVATACGLGRSSDPDQTVTAEPEPPREDDPEPDPEAEPEDPEPVDPPDDGTPAAPEPSPPYEVSGSETHPNAKAAGAGIAQALLTYDVGERLEDVVARATGERAGDRDVEAALEIFREDAWSRGEVVYPQFGGLTDEGRCSIMAVVRQTVGLPDGSELVEVRTLDVRLRVADGVWAFEQLASAGGEPVERPDDLSEVAAAVLDDERIFLPDSARWDIHRGHTSDELLEVMLRMAEHSGGYEVNVLDTGHPTHVFGTDRVSDHSRGRAVDIHRVGDRLVIDDRQEGSLTDRVVQAMYDDPDEPVIGSPWALDGFGGRSFTDPVHQDHLHVAVPRPQDEDDPPDEELAS